MPPQQPDQTISNYENLDGSVRDRDANFLLGGRSISQQARENLYQAAWFVQPENIGQYIFPSRDNQGREQRSDFQNDQVYRLSVQRAFRLENQHGIDFARQDYESAIVAADRINQSEIQNQRLFVFRNMLTIDCKLKNPFEPIGCGQCRRLTPGEIQNLHWQRGLNIRREDQMFTAYLAPATTRINYGLALMRSGNIAEGERRIQEALAIRPEISRDGKFQDCLQKARRSGQAAQREPEQPPAPSQQPAAPDLYSFHPGPVLPPQAKPTPSGSDVFIPQPPANWPIDRSPVPNRRPPEYKPTPSGSDLFIPQPPADWRVDRVPVPNGKPPANGQAEFDRNVNSWRQYGRDREPIPYIPPQANVPIPPGKPTSKPVPDIASQPSNDMNQLLPPNAQRTTRERPPRQTNSETDFFGIVGRLAAAAGALYVIRRMASGGMRLYRSLAGESIAPDEMRPLAERATVEAREGAAESRIRVRHQSSGEELSWDRYDPVGKKFTRADGSVVDATDVQFTIEVPKGTEAEQRLSGQRCRAELEMRLKGRGDFVSLIANASAEADGNLAGRERLMLRRADGGELEIVGTRDGRLIVASGERTSAVDLAAGDRIVLRVNGTPEQAQQAQSNGRHIEALRRTVCQDPTLSNIAIALRDDKFKKEKEKQDAEERRLTQEQERLEQRSNELERTRTELATEQSRLVLEATDIAQARTRLATDRESASRQAVANEVARTQVEVTRAEIVVIERTLGEEKTRADRNQARIDELEEQAKQLKERLVEQEKSLAEKMLEARQQEENFNRQELEISRREIDYHKKVEELKTKELNLATEQVKLNEDQAKHLEARRQLHEAQAENLENRQWLAEERQRREGNNVVDRQASVETGERDVAQLRQELEARERQNRETGERCARERATLEAERQALEARRSAVAGLGDNQTLPEELRTRLNADFIDLERREQELATQQRAQNESVAEAERQRRALVDAEKDLAEDRAALSNGQAESTRQQQQFEEETRRLEAERTSLAENQERRAGAAQELETNRQLVSAENQDSLKTEKEAAIRSRTELESRRTILEARQQTLARETQQARTALEAVNSGIQANRQAETRPITEPNPTQPPEQKPVTPPEQKPVAPPEQKPLDADEEAGSVRRSPNPKPNERLSFENGAPVSGNRPAPVMNLAQLTQLIDDELKREGLSPDEKKLYEDLKRELASDNPERRARTIAAATEVLGGSDSSNPEVCRCFADEVSRAAETARRDGRLQEAEFGEQLARALRSNNVEERRGGLAVLKDLVGNRWKLLGISAGILVLATAGWGLYQYNQRLNAVQRRTQPSEIRGNQ